MLTVYCLTSNLEKQKNSSMTFDRHTPSVMSEENGCRMIMVYNQDAVVIFYCFKLGYATVNPTQCVNVFLRCR